MNDDDALEAGRRDAMAFAAAVARKDQAAYDAILAFADIPVMADALAVMIVRMLSGLGIEDVSAHIQTMQHAWIAQQGVTNGDMT